MTNPAIFGGATAATTAATVAAAARAAEQARKEEEEMTPYTPEELDADWEFKIVRANSPLFRKPEALHRLVEEEARAGWVLLEKFDNYRVRFKRPASARAQDAYLPPDVNPYRTQVGGDANPTIAIAVILGVLLLLGLVGMFLFIAIR